MFYVSMTDKFMSGWGLAEGKTNKLVIECDNYDQAKEICDYAKSNRSEMKYINICCNRPRYGSNILVSKKTYNQMTAWRLKK
jgi:hypothetical protein